LRVRPADFRVALFDGPNREAMICRSKAIGEPPLMLAISVFVAIADAIHSWHRGSRHGSTPRRPGIDLACVRGVGAALNPL
jgi:xanthine dehydrogenase molybdopterin-binding subunit B